MTKTFERFLRSFTDEEFTAFAQDRARVRPPYWKVMQVALRIESDRRGLRFDDELLELVANQSATEEARTGTA